jgi:hypothetical protein
VQYPGRRRRYFTADMAAEGASQGNADRWGR